MVRGKRSFKTFNQILLQGLKISTYRYIYFELSTCLQVKYFQKINFHKGLLTKNGIQRIQLYKMCQNIFWSFLKRFQDKVSKLTLKPFLILLSWVLERSRSLKCGIEGKLNFIKVLRGLFCSHSFLMRMLPSKVPGSNVVIWNYQINWSWWNVKCKVYFILQWCFQFRA